ncbi:DNA translocase FtsK 4TM domain-containing protein [Thalassotalea psychrophila]|uniref:DNA translocase FtsK n=1 Tax=Thalassotalea psychrophila TaxID=3065647 RepID=A0ABY9TQH1_9GAMM|nr:DNA translocase FtsK 4TM domain-containing protein [Colwelliaceae bacterium SQ149]
MDATLAAKESLKLTGTQRLLEAGLIFTSIFSLYLIIALISFDPADPGWSQTAYHATVNNAGGAFGAYLSDIFLFAFGSIAYSLPFVFAIIGWLLFQRIHYLLDIDFFTLGLKFIGFMMFYIGLTSIASMNFDDVFDFSAGGIVGDYISYSLLPYFNFIGSSLLFLVLTCSGFVLLTGLSLFTIVDFIGEHVIKLALLIKSLLIGFKQHFNSTPVTADKQKNKTVAKEDADLAKTKDVQKADVDETIGAQADLAAQLFGSAKSSPTISIDEDNRADPVIADDGFVEIDDLIDEPMIINLDENIGENELDAAFKTVDKIDVEDDDIIENKSVSTAEKTAKADENPLERYKGMPTIDLLDKPNRTKNPISQEELDQVSRLVEAKLLDYGVICQVVDVFPGPVITRFELDLAPGVKVSKITGLSKDLARALSAASVRVVEVIPGKSVIGIEIPNKHREMVRLSEVIESEVFVNSKSSLTMVLGKDIAGDPIIADLAKMPHLLVAGTTGSGKSVVVNVMIVSMLYKSTPDDVRFIMIDPKMLELSVYEGIPHLLSEVVTDMKDAANALRWCVGEMERRYKLMSALGVRNLTGYNQKIMAAKEKGEAIVDPLWKPGDSMEETAPELDKLPSIVVVVDEFADMIMIVGKKVEELIARIAQKARAAGIHLILATQRPSVDVITGLIKANIPTRMALTVQSRIDSRTILDQQGAEQLLGNGDMLFLPQGTSVPSRAQGAFVDDHEVHAVVNDWKARGKPRYIEEILSGDTTEDTLLPGEAAEGEDQESDALYDEALMHVTESRRASISGVQRKFRIGYNRAARIIEQMEANGVVSSPGHNGNREVIAPPPVKN